MNPTTARRACSEGLLPVIKVLIEELGADHSPQDRWGGTPLNDAIRHKRIEVISYLKERGATLGQAATALTDPATELCNAAAKADIEDLRFLVREKGYDVNVGDYDKRTAIHLACSEGNLEVVKTLIDEVSPARAQRALRPQRLRVLMMMPMKQPTC